VSRFVIGSRQAIGVAAARRAERAARKTIDELGSSINIIAERTRRGERPSYRALFDAERLPRGMAARAAALDVVVEPEIPHQVAAPLRFAVYGDGAPLPDADLVATVTDGPGTVLQVVGSTDREGIATFALDAVGVAVTQLLTVPRRDYWPHRQPDAVPGSTINCERLDTGPYGWWHRLLNHSADGRKGKGVRVGIVDSGVGPSRCLDHIVDFGAILGGRRDRDAGADIHGHGTHVAGLIGARPLAAGHFSGIAYECDLASVRVFADGPSSQYDIVDALELLAGEFRADIINLSFVSPAPSRLERDFIERLANDGVVCVCAAGNFGTAVRWPAAFPAAVAVSAVGHLSQYERQTLSTDHRARWLPPYGRKGEWGTDPLWSEDDLYLAFSSCRGKPIFCAAPGVGIISTAPHLGADARFAGKDGTSMASPLACAVLAVNLSNDPLHRRLRGRARYKRAIAVLERSCRSVGLSAAAEGHGIPRCMGVPETARPRRAVGKPGARIARRGRRTQS
jgi:subtilisin